MILIKLIDQIKEKQKEQAKANKEEKRYIKRLSKALNDIVKNKDFDVMFSALKDKILSCVTPETNHIIFNSKEKIHHKIDIFDDSLTDIKKDALMFIKELRLRKGKEMYFKFKDIPSSSIIDEIGVPLCSKIKEDFFIDYSDSYIVKLSRSFKMSDFDVYSNRLHDALEKEGIQLDNNIDKDFEYYYIFNW